MRKEDVEITRDLPRKRQAGAHADAAYAELNDDRDAELEISVLLSTFDARLTASEKPIDRVLARLGLD